MAGGWRNNRYNAQCPCKDCQERYPACSDHCQRQEFIEWKAKRDKAKEEERRYKQSFDIVSDAKQREIWRSKRYSKRQKSHRIDDR